MNLIKIVGALLLMFFFLLFIAQNSGYVDVGFFYTTYSVPLFVLLLITFSLGFLLPSLYFLLREAGIRKHLKHIQEGLKEWSRGYIGRAERSLSSLKQSEGISSFLAELLWERGNLQELFTMPSLAVVGEIMLREGKEEAEKAFKEVLSKDPENLRALKGLRDFYALKDKWETALEYQEKVFELCEKWEKEEQKRIKAEIMTQVYLKNGEERLIEKAVDLYSSPFVQAVYIRHLLSQERIKEVRKQWDKAFSLGHQEELLWHLMEDQESLSKMLDLVEARAPTLSPDTLAMVYIKLNLLTKAKELEDKLSHITKTFLQSSLSHREQDRQCLRALKALLKPFSCSCGKVYNSYTPMCGACFMWGKVKLRRDMDAIEH